VGPLLVVFDVISWDTVVLELGDAMRTFTWGVMAVAAPLVAGCVTTETDVVRFQPKPQQQNVQQAGNTALVSKGKNSVVLLRPVLKEFPSGTRPVFFVGIENRSRQPVDFKVANVSVAQVTGTQRKPLKVYTQAELLGEEQERQEGEAVDLAIAAALNSSAAEASGYKQGKTMNIDVPIFNGADKINLKMNGVTTYDRTAAQEAHAWADLANAAMIGESMGKSAERLAELENTVVRDNRVAPNTWYGGQLHLEPPTSDGPGKKVYTIALMVGGDRHEIEVVQETLSQ
jgi:hypothetical protein